MEADIGAFDLMNQAPAKITDGAENNEFYDIRALVFCKSFVTTCNGVE